MLELLAVAAASCLTTAVVCLEVVGSRASREGYAEGFQDGRQESEELHELRRERAERVMRQAKRAVRKGSTRFSVIDGGRGDRE